VAGIEFARLRFRVQIHETADVAGAEQFWLTVTGAESTQFQRATIKRHNPRTTRKNVGVGYHGCLTITVSQSASLYRKIEGWVRGAMTGPAEPPESGPKSSTIG
jgi:hypothetical protein